MKKDGFGNDAYLELVPNISKWVRNEEKLTLYSPRPIPTNIPLTGIGLSVGGNITGEVLVVKDFEELEEKSNMVAGKIVLFNAKWVNYSKTVIYRTAGPSRAAKYGAIGCLVRSVTPFSIESPHTGALSYDKSYKKIPAACISIEDAEMFQRMFDRGQTISINLFMGARFEGYTNSYNVIAELKGTEKPEEVILIGGHIDSWDVGPQTGANDDGGGFMVCYQALRTLKFLGLRPKRTIRYYNLLYVNFF